MFGLRSRRRRVVLGDAANLNAGAPEPPLNGDCRGGCADMAAGGGAMLGHDATTSTSTTVLPCTLTRLLSCYPALYCHCMLDDDNDAGCCRTTESCLTHKVQGFPCQWTAHTSPRRRRKRSTHVRRTAHDDGLVSRCQVVIAMLVQCEKEEEETGFGRPLAPRDTRYAPSGVHVVAPTAASLALGCMSYSGVSRSLIADWLNLLLQQFNMLKLAGLWLYGSASKVVTHHQEVRLSVAIGT